VNQSDLKKLLHYCPASGLFIRRVSVGGAMVGDIAEAKDKDGYICIRVYGKKYKAHCLDFL